MCKRIEQNRLFDLFKINNLSELIIVLDNGAPSLIEFQIRDLINNYGEDSLLIHSNIQETIRTGDLDIQINYNNEFFINDNQKTNDTTAYYANSLF